MINILFMLNVGMALVLLSIIYELWMTRNRLESIEKQLNYNNHRMVDIVDALQQIQQQTAHTYAKPRTATALKAVDVSTDL